MILIPRRAERSHRVKHPDRLEPHAVRCPLDKKHLLLLARRSPSVADAEEHRRLMEDNRLRTVQILRLRIIQAACGKTDYMPEAVLNRNDDPVLVKIIALPVEQPQLIKKILLHLDLAERMPIVRREPDALHRAVLLSPPMESVTLRLLGKKKLLAVEVRHLPVSNPQRLTL